MTMNVLYVLMTVLFILLFYGEMKKNANELVKDLLLGLVSFIALIIRLYKKLIP